MSSTSVNAFPTESATRVRTDSPPAREDRIFYSHGVRCAAWWYPTPLAKKGPVVVLAHGLGGTREMRLDAYARKFQAAGYSAFVFDYRFNGASEGYPRYLIDISLQRQDWAAALTYIRSLPLVDPDQVGIFGTSFGGGHVLTVAADDQNIKAVISQCPFTSGLASSLTVGILPSLGLAWAAAKDLIWGAKVGDSKSPIVGIPVAGSTGTVAFLNAADSYPGAKALGAKDEDNIAAARLVPHLAFNEPGRSAKHVQAPIFFAVCEKDTCAPAKTTLHYAKQAPNPTIKEYADLGHFDIYVGEAFEEASKDYVGFLLKHLPVV